MPPLCVLSASAISVTCASYNQHNGTRSVKRLRHSRSCGFLFEISILQEIELAGLFHGLTRASLLICIRGARLFVVKSLARDAFPISPHEDRQLLHRTQATQRLQSCDRVCGCCVAVDSDCDAGLSVLRNSE